MRYITEKCMMCAASFALAVCIVHRMVCWSLIIGRVCSISFRRKLCYKFDSSKSNMLFWFWVSWSRNWTKRKWNGIRMHFTYMPKAEWRMKEEMCCWRFSISILQFVLFGGENWTIWKNHLIFIFHFVVADCFSAIVYTGRLCSH